MAVQNRPGAIKSDGGGVANKIRKKSSWRRLIKWKYKKGLQSKVKFFLGYLKITIMIDYG